MGLSLFRLLFASDREGIQLENVGEEWIEGMEIK